MFGLRLDHAADPGTTSARTPWATCRPRATEAAARISSMRPFVQLPMNTTSIGTSVKLQCLASGCKSM